MYCKILVNWINQKIYFCLHIVNAFSWSFLSFYDKTNIVATWYGTGKEKGKKTLNGTCMYLVVYLLQTFSEEKVTAFKATSLKTVNFIRFANNHVS